MDRTTTSIVMAVVYGYAVWILSEYLWDWWRHLREARRQHPPQPGPEQQAPVAPEPRDEGQPPEAA